MLKSSFEPTERPVAHPMIVTVYRLSLTGTLAQATIEQKVKVS
jgi:hypothetical protein